VGIARHGGALTAELRKLLVEATRGGLSLVRGWHQYTSDDLVTKTAAEQTGALILDVRKPKPKEQLRFWTAEICRLKALRIQVPRHGLCHQEADQRLDPPAGSREQGGGELIYPGGCSAGSMAPFCIAL